MKENSYLDFFEIGNIFGAIIHYTYREKKRDLYPVKFRITHQRRRIYLNAGFDLSKNEWKELPKAKGKILKKTRELIKSGFNNIKEAIENILKSGEYSHEKLARVLKKGKKEFIEDAYKNRIADLTTAGQVGTTSIYKSAMEHIKNYQANVRFVDVTGRWLELYERHALETITASTLSIYLRTLCTLFNIAIQDGVVTKSAYPFSQSRHDNKFSNRLY
jgi:integrase/recombinase XerD